MRTWSSKTLMLIIVVAMLASACGGGPGSNGDERRLPEATEPDDGPSPYMDLEVPEEIEETGRGFFLTEVEDMFIEDFENPVETTVETLLVGDDEVEKVVGAATADEKGATAFYDPVVETTIHVQVINLEGDPVPGVLVEYLALEEKVIITATDPEGTYSEGIAVFSYDQLIAQELSRSFLAPISDLFIPQPAYAESLNAPLKVVPIVVIVLGAIAAYNSYVFLSDVHAIITNPRQFQETANDRELIWCDTPEGIAAREGIATDIVVGFLVRPIEIGDEVADIIMNVGELTVSEVISALRAQSKEEPVLVRRYSHLPDQVDIVSDSDESGLAAITTASAYYTYENIGSCTEVPDLGGMDWDTARAILDQKGISWTVVYQSNSVNVDELPADTPGMVLLQSHPPIRDDGEVSLIALGNWPGIDNTMEITVIPVPTAPVERAADSPSCVDYFGEDYLLWAFGESDLRCGFAHSCSANITQEEMENACTSAAPGLVLDAAFEFAEGECHCAFYAPPGEYEIYSQDMAFLNGSVTVRAVDEFAEGPWQCVKVAERTWHFSWVDSYLYYSDEDGDGEPDLSVMLNEVEAECGSIDLSIFVMDEKFR